MKLIYFLILNTVFVTASAQKPYQLDGSEVVINKPILFQTGTATLLKESEEAILIIKQYLDEKAAVTLLRVEGHTDNYTAESQMLSEQRAMAICKKLIGMGINCKRLLAVGFGANKPIADNSTSEGKARNRRIAFVNTQLLGRTIGGLSIDGGGKVAGDSCN